jgi:hypothetical protein
MLVVLVLEVAIAIVLVRGPPPPPPSFSGPCCCSGGTFATTHSRAVSTAEVEYDGELASSSACRFWSVSSLSPDKRITYASTSRGDLRSSQYQRLQP